MKEQVQQYIKHCQRCQKGKATNKAPAGELLPLPTPQGPWQDITIDFTEMPESLSYNNILVVVDCVGAIPALHREMLVSSSPVVV